MQAIRRTSRAIVEKMIIVSKKEICKAHRIGPIINEGISQPMPHGSKRCKIIGTEVGIARDISQNSGHLLYAKF